MPEITIAGEEIRDGEVTEFGNGAHIVVPKRWIGSEVKVVRVSEPAGSEE